MTMVRYPLPITNAMLLPPTPTSPSRAMTRTGLPTGTARSSATRRTRPRATQAIANSCSARVETDYDPQHQKAKAGDMVPPLQIVDDLGKDYGIYAGGAGRTGYVTPQSPYPDATSPPVVTNVSPAGGGLAGGTAITITGIGFTGRHRRDGRRHRRDRCRRRQPLHHHLHHSGACRRHRRYARDDAERRQRDRRLPPTTSSTHRPPCSFRPNDQMHLPGLGVPVDPWTGASAAAGRHRAAARLKEAERISARPARTRRHHRGLAARQPPHGAGLHQAGGSHDVGCCCGHASTED